MKVAYCANRKLYSQLPTAINSLLQNNSVEKIYLFIEDNSIDYISHPSIEFINCQNYDFLIKKGINCTKRFPYMAMVRCFFSRLIPNEDKILYLDVDTVVDENIESLWDINLEGNYLAAREEDEGYFNSGVILFNLKKIRESDSERRLVNLLNTCKFVFPDQDAMNIAYKGNIICLEPKYNALGRDDVYRHPIAIRHYAGQRKPWENEATELDKAFWNKYKVDKI